MSIATLRRQVKNVAYNFSDAQVKVREATSNDPWGPTTALMSEIADLTHNPISFTEIMSMLWKRLNDHGKNWRHVYKSLVLLDYLIKCGSEKVAQQCRENIYSIETLKDFQHIEDNRDQGLNVREKAKQMVALLYDEERLKNERARFLMTRKRFTQNGTGVGSDGTVRTTRKSDTGVIGEYNVKDFELEEARPSSIGEEEMQLQIALALSREECEKEEELRKGDDIRLQLAIEESKREHSVNMTSVDANGTTTSKTVSLSQSAIDDLLSLGLGMPSEPVQQQQYQSTSLLDNPWGGHAPDPWTPVGATTSDTLYPLLNSTAQLTSTPLTPASNDPWAPVNELPSFAPQPSRLLSSSSTAANDPWSAFNAEPAPLAPIPAMSNGTSSPTSNTTNGTQSMGQQHPNLKTPESFLGENSALVNLDNLMGPSSTQAKPASNPFMIGSTTTTTNPFAQQRPSPSLNEMMVAQKHQMQPLQPTPTNQARSSTNPFLL